MGGNSYSFELMRQRLILLALVLLMALGVSAHTQRALFSATLLLPAPPTAFAAFTPPPPPVADEGSGVLPRQSRSLGSSFVRPVADPPAKPASYELPAALDPEEVAVLQFAPLPVIGAFGDLNPDMIALLTPGDAPPEQVAQNSTPISAVPEISTWAMLLIGFFAVGGSQRALQRRARFAMVTIR
jgi:hypothetical protein